MKKTFLIIISCLFIINEAKAQDFYHSAGLGYMMLFYNQAYTGQGVDASYSGGAAAPVLVYNPMLAFDAGRHSSFVLAAYPSLGFSFNSREGASSFGLNLPVVGEMFFGDVDDAGGFLGLGFNYGIAADDQFSGATGGPQISGGGQFEISRNLIKLRAAYTLGLIKKQDPDYTYTKDTRNILTLMVTYPLGQ